MQFVDACTASKVVPRRIGVDEVVLKKKQLDFGEWK